MHRKMIVAVVLGAALGVAANLLAPGAAWVETLAKDLAQPIGQLFIRLLFMIVVPMLFS